MAKLLVNAVFQFDLLGDNRELVQRDVQRIRVGGGFGFTCAHVGVLSVMIHARS